MKLRAALTLGLILLAAPALAQTHKAKHPRHKPAAAAAAPTLAPQMFDANGDIVYLSQLHPVPVVSGTDTTFWCDYAPGCGPGIDLKRVTAQQIGQYAVGRLGVNPPLAFNGSVVSLNFDSTLTVVGNQLHVVGGAGGGGFPWVLGSTTIPGSTSVPVIANLQLNNSVLAGNVGGSPVYTATPSYTGLSPGTPVVCLGLDGGNHLITTPCGSGPPPAGGFLLADTGSILLVDTGSHFLIQ
jgi:hypothetical protein